MDVLKSVCFLVVPEVLAEPFGKCEHKVPVRQAQQHFI
jgi:hypothetical protein